MGRGFFDIFGVRGRIAMGDGSSERARRELFGHINFFFVSPPGVGRRTKNTISHVNQMGTRAKAFFFNKIVTRPWILTSEGSSERARRALGVYRKIFFTLPPGAPLGAKTQIVFDPRPPTGF